MNGADRARQVDLTKDIAIHPGAAHRPSSGIQWCSQDVGGDGWFHIPLRSAAERDALLTAALHDWWDWYNTVEWVSWWPEGNVFGHQDGIPHSHTGALVATFAEFKKSGAGRVLAVLRGLRAAPP